MIDMRRSLSLLFVFSLVAGLTLGACSEAKPKEKARTAEQIIQDIGDEFATANDLEFDLNTEKLPGDVNGIKNAVGAGNRSPAFIGTVDLITGGVAAWLRYLVPPQALVQRANRAREISFLKPLLALCPVNSWRDCFRRPQRNQVFRLSFESPRKVHFTIYT